MDKDELLTRYEAPVGDRFLGGESLTPPLPTFPQADQVGRLVVFNVGGNRFGLVAKVDYRWQKLFVRRIMTHQEYDRGGWKNDPWL